MITTVLVTTFYLPFLNRDFSTFTALSNYLSNWEFNGPVYNILKYFLNDGNLIRLISGSAFVITTGIIAFVYKNFTKAAYAVFIALIVFSSTIYPWYLGWIAVLNPIPAFYSVTSLLFTSNFTNFTPLAPVWREYLLILLIQYVPFFILLVLDVFRLRNEKRETKKRTKGEENEKVNFSNNYVRTIHRTCFS